MVYPYNEIRLLIRASTQVNLTDTMLRTGSQIQFHLCEVVECEKSISGGGNDISDCFGQWRLTTL